MRLLAIPAFEDNYIWALVDDDGDALIVDPGEAAPVLAATAHGLWPAAVLVTHHHPDHCGGVPALRERWPTLPVFAPEDARIQDASERVGAGSQDRRQALAIVGAGGAGPYREPHRIPRPAASCFAATPCSAWAVRRHVRRYAPHRCWLRWTALAALPGPPGSLLRA
jgi:glyoxylase-like metal-dependent hydrolase (beta-lactamase superfamily II)